MLPSCLACCLVLNPEAPTQQPATNNEHNYYYPNSLNSTMADDEVQALVLDNGSGMCKAGKS